jgi:hypothetical protein
MAGSSRPGPQIPPTDTACTPPRTPGSLGINDQADPNIATLLGDTPGSVGWLDGADPTLPLYSSTDPYANLVCRDLSGTALAIGLKLPASLPVAAQPSPQYVSLDQAQEVALKITTYFEGGKSMNYQALADDSDGQGTSFGLIQWNFGQNTLGPLLKKMLDKDEQAFKACFGDGADFGTLRTALAAGKQADELKWARDRLKNNRAAWSSAFMKIGANAAFNAIQRQQAAAPVHRYVVAAIKQIRGIIPDLFKNIELRTYAALYDLAVQQQTITKSLTAIRAQISHDKPSTQLDAMKIIVTLRALRAKKIWEADCLSRRMGILTAGAYKATEEGKTVTRKNPQFSLIAASGTKYVTGL